MWKILSRIQPPNNSTIEHIIIPPKNNNHTLFFTGSNIIRTPTIPQPYIGHTGPFKKPLLTTFPVVTATKATSTHQPRKLYIKNKSIIS